MTRSGNPCDRRNELMDNRLCNLRARDGSSYIGVATRVTATH